MLRHLWLLGLLGCVESNAIQCANGETCPATWQCDDAHGGCIVQEQRDACMGLGDGTECIAPNVSDEGVCDAGVCLTNVCGDGYRARAESCDGAALGQVASCTQLGYYDEVALGCTATCELDRTVCTGFCGDDVVNGDEECDGALPVRTCVDFGYLAGAIECASTCGPDLTACVPQGWRVVPMPSAVQHVHGTSASNVWVVGDAGMVQRFDGATWQAVNVSTCTTQPLHYVHVLSATDAFLLDETGIIRVDAAGCTKYMLPIQPRFHSIWATSLDDAYVGFDDSFVGTWHFDGTSWSQADTTRARFVWGTGPSNVYTASSRLGSLRRFDGTSWSSVPVPGMTKVLGLWGTGGSDIYVAGVIPRLVGNTTVDRGAIAHWDGATWTTTLDDPPALLGYDLPFGGTRTGSAAGARSYAVGYSGATNQLLAWDGLGWTAIDAPATSGGAVPFATDDGGLLYAPVGRAQVLVFEGALRLETAPLLDSLKVFAARDGVLATVFENSQRRIWAWRGAAWQADADFIADAVTVPDGDTFVVTSTSIGRRLADGTYSYLSNPGVGGVFISGTSATDLWTVNQVAGTVTQYNFETALGDSYLIGIPTPSRVVALTPNHAFAFSGAANELAEFDGMNWTTIQIDATVGAIVRDLSSLSRLGVHTASATDAYAWSPSGIVHYDGTSWSVLSPPPPLTRVEHVWGSRNQLFAAGDLGLHYYDGTRWTPVNSGFTSGVRSIDVRGDSILIGSFEGVRRIYRTRAW